MVDFNNMRNIVVQGLSSYIDCPVIRANQNKKPPEQPYCSYTVTTLMSENKGTYGVYEDGKERKPIKQIWSITVQSGDNLESIELANKAHEWLDHVGTVTLSDNKIIVQSVGNVTNRDNILTVEYEYKNGFDVTFLMMNEVDSVTDTTGYIETAEIERVDMPEEETLDIVVENLRNQVISDEHEAQRLLNRLEGIV